MGARPGRRVGTRTRRARRRARRRRRRGRRGRIRARGRGVSVAAEVRRGGRGGGGLGGDARHHASRPAEALEAVDENHRGGGRAGRATGLEHVAHGTRAARTPANDAESRDRDRGRHAQARVKPDRLVVQGAPVPGDISCIAARGCRVCEFVVVELVVVLGSVPTRARGPAMGGREALRAVARADLNQLVGGLALLEQEGARSRRVSASALALESCGRTFWVGCESGRWFGVASRRAPTPREVWTRVSVEDDARRRRADRDDARPPRRPTPRDNGRPRPRPGRVRASGHPQCASSRRSRRSRAPPRSPTPRASPSTHRDVFAIPGTARADAIAADALGATPPRSSSPTATSNDSPSSTSLSPRPKNARRSSPPRFEPSSLVSHIPSSNSRGSATTSSRERREGTAAALELSDPPAFNADRARRDIRRRRARGESRRLEIRRPKGTLRLDVPRRVRGGRARARRRIRADEENREDARSEDARSSRPDARRVGRRRGPESPGRGLLFSARVAVVSRAVRRARPRREFRRERYRYLGASRARRWRLAR